MICTFLAINYTDCWQQYNLLDTLLIYYDYRIPCICVEYFVSY